MSNDEIKELVQIFIESGVAELELKRGENSLRLRQKLWSGAHHGAGVSPHDGPGATRPGGPAGPTGDHLRRAGPCGRPGGTRAI